MSGRPSLRVGGSVAHRETVDRLAAPPIPLRCERMLLARGPSSFDEASAILVGLGKHAAEEADVGANLGDTTFEGELPEGLGLWVLDVRPDVQDDDLGGDVLYHVLAARRATSAEAALFAAGDVGALLGGWDVELRTL